MKNDSMTTQDKSTYYYNNNKRVILARESSVYAVKFVTGRDPRDGSLSRAAFRLLNEESENIGYIPNYDFRIFKKQDVELKSSTLSSQFAMSRAVEELKVEPSIEFATVAYRRVQDIPATRIDDLMFSTREFIVQFKPEVSATQIAELNERHQVEMVKPVGYAENGYVLRAPDADGENGPVVLSNIYHETGMVLFAHPNFVQRKHLRTVMDTKKISRSKITDLHNSKNSFIKRADYLSQQWHLETALVTDAWAITRGSSSIKVAILDDGVDITHPEFADKVFSQYDFASGTADGLPKNTGDNHGTACAGVAVAAGVKAFGSAPDCSLIVANTPSFLGSVEEGEMFKWVCDQGADVISCSWGPKDMTGAVDPLPDNVRAAINYCVTQGRGGLGTCVFWAAGNGNESVSNDGYASNPDVIAVAASSSNETRSWYSDFGPEIFICAPSSGDSAVGELRIFTADRQGDDGYNPDKKTGLSHPADDLDYTDSFGGTSSATPLCAGIASLMLSINPELTVVEIKNILKNTADKIDNSGGNYDETGHSIFYGYGRINAAVAVESARDLIGADPIDDHSGSIPTITTVFETKRSEAPPLFEIEKAGRIMYAVELTSEAELFNTAIRESDRNELNFFGSWATGMVVETPYTIPAENWELLKSAERLYYRIHVADDSSWNNYGVSTADENPSNAPYFDIIGDVSPGNDDTGGEDEGGLSNEFSIKGPENIARDDQAPKFEINLGGRKMYAVEVATEASLFNNSVNGAKRESSNFYASWESGLSTKSPFVLPEDVWENLKVADALYYRAHVADDNNWSNYGLSVNDDEYASAPVMQILSDARFFKNRLATKSTVNIIPFILSEAKYEDEKLWQR